MHKSYPELDDNSASKNSSPQAFDENCMHVPIQYFPLPAAASPLYPCAVGATDSTPTPHSQWHVMWAKLRAVNHIPSRFDCPPLTWSKS